MSSEAHEKKALITGAGRGLGREIAMQLARRGVSVALTARSAEELDGVAAAIRSEGGKALVVVADVAEAAGRAEVLAATADGIGDVDILINNAATVAPLGAFTSLTETGWEAALRTNVIAPAQLSAAVIPGMVDAGWGRIVNVSSGVAAHPATMIGGNIYASTKAALEAHTVNLAAELADTGVTVNAYRPGMVDTAMQGWIRAQDPAIIGRQLHDRFTQAHDDGLLLGAVESAASLIDHLDARGAASGAIWDVASRG